MNHAVVIEDEDSEFLGFYHLTPGRVRLVMDCAEYVGLIVTIRQDRYGIYIPFCIKVLCKKNFYNNLR